MSDVFSVDMSPPKHQGMTLAFSAGDQHFSENFSTKTFPFLDNLIRAIHGLRHGYVDEKILLFIGAPECELSLQAEVGSNTASLRIVLWRDGGRSRFAKTETLFAIETFRSEIVLAFVAAARRLRDSIDDDTFLREYGAPFPKLAYQQLMSG